MSRTPDVKRWSNPGENPVAGVLGSIAALFVFGWSAVRALLDGTILVPFVGTIESAAQPIAFAIAGTVLALFTLAALVALIGYSRDILFNRQTRKAS